MRENFSKWKEAFESKKLKVNLRKIKVMVSGSKIEIENKKIEKTDYIKNKNAIDRTKSGMLFINFRETSGESGHLR